jgi:hypothetical protein
MSTALISRTAVGRRGRWVPARAMPSRRRRKPMGTSPLTGSRIFRMLGALLLLLRALLLLGAGAFDRDFVIDGVDLHLTQVAAVPSACQNVCVSEGTTRLVVARAAGWYYTHPAAIGVNGSTLHSVLTRKKGDTAPGVVGCRADRSGLVGPAATGRCRVSGVDRYHRTVWRALLSRDVRIGASRCGVAPVPDDACTPARPSGPARTRWVDVRGRA